MHYPPFSIRSAPVLSDSFLLFHCASWSLFPCGQYYSSVGFPCFLLGVVFVIFCSSFDSTVSETTVFEKMGEEEEVEQLFMLLKKSFGSFPNLYWIGLKLFQPEAWKDGGGNDWSFDLIANVWKHKKSCPKFSCGWLGKTKLIFKKCPGNKTNLFPIQNRSNPTKFQIHNNCYSIYYTDIFPKTKYTWLN